MPVTPTNPTSIVIFRWNRGTTDYDSIYQAEVAAKPDYVNGKLVLRFRKRNRRVASADPKSLDIVVTGRVTALQVECSLNGGTRLRLFIESSATISVSGGLQQ